MFCDVLLATYSVVLSLAFLFLLGFGLMFWSGFCLITADIYAYLYLPLFLRLTYLETLSQSAVIQNAVYLPSTVMKLR